MLHSDSVIRFYWPHVWQGKYLNSPFVIRVIFGKYYHRLWDVYSVNKDLKYRRNIPVSFMSAHTDHLLPNHTASHRRRQQALQTPESNMYKFLYTVGLYPQINRHFKWKTSELVSQNLWTSFSRDVNIGFFVSRLLLASPSISRNTLI